MRGGLSRFVCNGDVGSDFAAGRDEYEFYVATGCRQLARGQDLDHERSWELLSDGAGLAVTGDLRERDVVAAAGRIGEQDVASAADDCRGEKYENWPPGGRSELEHKAHVDYGVAPDVLRYRVKGGVQ